MLVANGYLPEQQAVGDVLGHHEATDEMLDRSGLATVRSQHKRVQTLLTATDSTFIHRILTIYLATTTTKTQSKLYVHN